MSQHESSMLSQAELCAALGASEKGAQVSGGRLHQFREGWATSVLTSSGGLANAMPKAHHFTRHELSNTVVAACGYAAPVSMLFGAGTVERCRKCRQKLGHIRTYR